MKPLSIALWAALALLLATPLLLFLEIRLVGREAVEQTLPLLGIALVLWLSAVVEAIVIKSIDKGNAQLQLKVMMLCKALRFLLAAVLLIAYAMLSDGDARLFAVNLIVLYFTVTAVLTVGHVRRKKQIDNIHSDKA